MLLLFGYEWFEECGESLLIGYVRFTERNVSLLIDGETATERKALQLIHYESLADCKACLTPAVDSSNFWLQSAQLRQSLRGRECMWQLL